MEEKSPYIRKGLPLSYPFLFLVFLSFPLYTYINEEATLEPAVVNKFSSLLGDIGPPESESLKLKLFNRFKNIKRKLK